ncbi:complement component 1, r subcomponent [Aplochiton taeniatus]
MNWTNRVIWLLCLSACECWRLPRSQAPMHGEVNSTQYPEPYGVGLLKQWDLSVPEGYNIQLTFSHLDIEASADCYYDAVTVLYDRKILGKFCGQENSADGHHPGSQRLLSPGNRLTIIFQSDDSNPEHHRHIGFSAHWEAIDIDECSRPNPEDGSGPICSQLCHNTLGSYLCSCHHGYELRGDQRTCLLSCGGGIFDEPEGQISSPGYPDLSPQGLSCQYIISVEPGFIVTLNFTDSFHIESIDTKEGPTCLYHWLQMSIPNRDKVTKLCGGNSPGLMATNSHSITLDYHTDWAGQSRGWSFFYTTQRVECASPGGLNHGRVTPVFPQYFYRDYIQVRCDDGYKLMTEGKEIESFSTMCQSSGQWHLPLPECQIIDCGEPEPLLNGGVMFLSGTENQYGAVVQYHCNAPFYSLLERKNVCGQPTVEIPAIQRILGGAEAPAYAIPWQALLSASGGRGGGIVIGDRWVMTAAHNLVWNGRMIAKDSLRVFIGDNDADKLSRRPHATVVSLHVHPGYKNPNRLDYDNDIALIKLEHAITFNNAVMPVCLPEKEVTYKTGQIGLVSGFGIQEGDIIANRLRYIPIPVVDPRLCRESVSSPNNQTDVPKLTDNMFCAGVPEAGTDSCAGDSGGAYALRTDERFWAAGIVSWGLDCGKPGKYGIYTRVANYVDWLKEIMQG